MTNFWKDLTMIILAILITLFTQSIIILLNQTPTDTAFSFGHELKEMLLAGSAMISIILLALLIYKLIPSKLPLFAYVTLIGIALCLPQTAIREFIITYTNKIDFLSCCVGLMAFAGLSVGGRLTELKQHSWKVILIFLIVSTCCFIGGALVAQISFSLVGII